MRLYCTSKTGKKSENNAKCVCSLYTFRLNLTRMTLPDDLHICVRVAQILEAVCHHWHKAGIYQTALQPGLHLRSLSQHPVETS